MPDYQKAKIYKIISQNTDKIYIGSTTKHYLSTRLAHHKCVYNKWKKGEHHKITSFDIIQFDDCKIILIENYPCNTKEELEAREYHHIKENNDLIVNSHMPSRTKKKYEEEHKEHLETKRKQWREENKEHLKEYKKQWAIKNKIKKQQIDIE
jgi:calcineurin-like phosphoesterase family protein